MKKMINFMMLTLFAGLSYLGHAAEIELLSAGDFSKITRQEFNNKWGAAAFAGQSGNSLEFKSTPSGQNFVSLVAHSDKQQYFYICQMREALPVNPNWNTLTVKAVYRVNDIEPMPESWKNFRFAIQWFDASGEAIPNVHTQVFKEATTHTEWQVGEQEITKPPQAVSYQLQFGSGGAKLSVDVARVSLSPKGVTGDAGAIPDFDSSESGSSTPAKQEEIDSESYL